MTDILESRIGACVSIRRRDLNLTQRALAEPCGVSFQQIQKYERGQNRVSAAMLWHLATALAVPVDYFFQDFPAPAKAAAASPKPGDRPGPGGA
ncbi:helix-turn-helix transcriptional regulator [Phenylobacterium sp.]|uniref:helix-turn-helix domain-containing protein n=1 Tax=Phenylobacterium sp. TaxID=1871053 RepID=UPI00286B1F10|nr:helix-turn-helix transcriptional regulator [Phenylobacterium sp.]